MVAIIGRPAADPRLADLVAGDDRASATLLYLRHLVRLVALEAAGGADLTGREQRRLRGRAVLASVRALTELDDGAAASELLREAGRPPRRPRPPIGYCRAITMRTVASSSWISSPDMSTVTV
jgi:hypothetical protein